MIVILWVMTMFVVLLVVTIVSEDCIVILFWICMRNVCYHLLGTRWMLLVQGLWIVFTSSSSCYSKSWVNAGEIWENYSWSTFLRDAKLSRTVCLMWWATFDLNCIFSATKYLNCNLFLVICRLNRCTAITTKEIMCSCLVIVWDHWSTMWSILPLMLWATSHVSLTQTANHWV